MPAYSPRWLWQIYRLVERSPVLYWVLGLALVVVLGVAKHLIAWDLGLLPRWEVNRYLATGSLYLVVVPYVWQILNHHAVRAFAELRAKVPEQQLRVSLSEFLSLPTFAATFIALAAAVAGYFEFSRSAASIEPLAAQVLPIDGAVEWSLTFVICSLLILRVIVQVRMIRKILEGLDLDFFNPGPVYTLSRYCAAFTTTVLLTFHGLTLLTLPNYYLSSSGLVFHLMLSAGALITFIAPLSSITRRLSRAKEALLCRIGEDQRRVNDRLHEAIGSGSMGSLEELRVAVGVLKEQREVLERLPTWPWMGQSIRGVAPALLIPVVVYVVQRLVGLILGI